MLAEIVFRKYKRKLEDDASNFTYIVQEMQTFEKSKAATFHLHSYLIRFHGLTDSGEVVFRSEEIIFFHYN